MDEVSTLNLKPLLVRYGVVLALAELTLIGINLLLGDVLGYLLLMVNIVVPTMVPVYAAVQPFVSKHQRLFTKGERKLMTWASFGLDVLIHVIFLLITLGFYYSEGLVDVIAGMMSLAGFVILPLAVTGLLHWWLMYWMYGWMPKICLTALEKANKRGI